MDDSDSQAGHPEWNPALERVLKKEGEQAQVYSSLHSHAASWASRRNDWIQLPAIIIATITGFFSATSEMVPPIAIGALSILVGALNTVNSYYRFSQRAEGHRITSLWYSKTYKNIETQLSLPYDQRQSADSLLKELREGMSRVGETAPPLPEASVSAFKAKFPNPSVSVPLVANGLDAIQIYKAESHKSAASPVAAPPTPKSPVKVTVMV